MFEGYTVADFRGPDVTIHYRKGGSGPPLLLLHGNPMTHVAWHKVADRLAERYTVVAADLRGYGDSTCPDEPGENNSNYSFRAMAQDQVDLMEHLGFKEFFAAGHDRGARTVHRMALDHPDRLKRLALLDILPSHHVWTHTSRQWAMSSWHWLFMVQPAPFPETMMGSVPAQWFMEKKLGKAGIGLAPFTKEAFAEYVRCFNEKTIRGSCGDYRATATIDFELDSQDLERGNLVSQPLLALWGKQSHTGRVYGDVLAVWQKYARNLRGNGLDCGHYVPEEAPDAVYEAFIEFFK
jgi:haloacetate dehalogenase